MSRALHPPGSLNPAHLAQPESLPTAERHRRRTAWTGLAVAGALRRAAVEAAFAPWSTAAPKTTRRAWHALPPGDLGRMRLMWLYRRADVEGARKLLVATEAFLKTPAPMRVDGSFPTGAYSMGLEGGHLLQSVGRRNGRIATETTWDCVGKAPAPHPDAPLLNAPLPNYPAASSSPLLPRFPCSFLPQRKVPP